jgi:hypothetical protein
MARAPKTTTEETGAPVGAPAPPTTEIARRLEAERLPHDWLRLLSSVVTGVATLLFALSTAGAIVKADGVFEFVVLTSILGGMTTGFAWLTWRWARSLPAARLLATPRERDELDG